MGPTPDIVLRSFVGEPPRHIRPTLQAHQLAVALVWGADHLIDMREIKSGERLTIGADARATMQVLHEVTRLGPLPILEPQPGGRFKVFLPAGATARLRKDGEDLSVVQLLERGLAEPIHAPVEGAMCLLDLNDRAVLHFDQVRLIARYLRPSTQPTRSPFTPAFWSRVAIYVMTASTLYGMAAVTDFEDLFSRPSIEADGW